MQMKLTEKLALGLLTLTLFAVICGMSFAVAEGEVPYRLPFDPADTWEEAQNLDLEIIDIMDDPQYSWFHIVYLMPDSKKVTAFYRTENGSFSWAEVEASDYVTLPEGVWGYFRYDYAGRMDDSYFCADDTETGYPLHYCYYDTYMNPTGLDFYYYRADLDEPQLFYYNYWSREWSYPDGVSELPFNGDEIIADIYHPDVRIVRNPPTGLPDDLELTFTEPDRTNYKPIVPANSRGFSMDTYLMSVSLNNEALFREICTTPPVISWVQLSGPDTAVYLDAEGVIRLAGKQSEPCELVYEVNATWGEYTTTTHFSVVFFDCELPETLGFHTAYTLNVGDTLKLSANFDNGEWPYRIWRGLYIEDYDSSVFDSEGEWVIGWWNEDFKTETDSGSDTWIEAYRPGTAKVYVNANQDGLSWYGAIVITVLGEEEKQFTLSLPADLQVVDAEAFLGSKAQKVILPQGCKRIGEKAFANMTKLQKIVIPDSVMEFADDFLYGSDQVTIVTPENSPIYLWAIKNNIPVEAK